MSTAEYDTTANWLIKTETGDVFGPVDFALLLSWVKEGRVAPGYLLSQNRVAWFEPSVVSELEMDWVADIPETGLFGPVHSAVIDELRTIHGSALRVFTIPVAPKPVVEAESVTPLKNRLSQFEKEIAGLGQLLTGEKKLAQDLTVRVADEQKIREQSQAAAEKQIRELTEQKVRQAELQNELLAVTQLHQAAAAKAVTQASRIAELEEALASESAVRVAIEAGRAEGTQTLDTLNGQLAALERKLTSESTVRAAAEAKTLTQEKQIAELEEAVASESTVRAATEAKTLTQEQRIAELEEAVASESALRVAIEAGRAEGTQTLDTLNGQLATLERKLTSESTVRAAAEAKTLKQEKRIAELEAAVASESALRAASEASCTESAQTLDTLNGHLAELKQKFDDACAARTVAEDASAAKDVAIAAADGRIAELTTRLAADSEVLMRQERQIAGLEEAVAAESLALTAERAARAEVEIAFTAQEAVLAQRVCELAELHRALDSAKTLQSTTEARVVQLQSDCAEAEQMLASERVAIETIRAELLGTVAEVNRQREELRRTLTDERAAAEARGAEKNVEIAALTQQVADVTAKLVAEQTIVETLNATLVERNQRLTELDQIFGDERTTRESVEAILATKVQALAEQERQMVELRQSLTVAYAVADSAQTEKDAVVAKLTQEITDLGQKLDAHARKPQVEIVHEVEIVGHEPKVEPVADKKKSDFVSLETQLMQELNRVQSGKSASGGARKGFGFFSGKD